eukprot:1141402-Pelagomonas_calceolata.AAC.2
MLRYDQAPSDTMHASLTHQTPALTLTPHSPHNHSLVEAVPLHTNPHQAPSDTEQVSPTHQTPSLIRYHAQI